MINLALGIFAVVFSVRCLQDGFAVLKGRTTDKSGRTLWVYYTYKNGMRVTNSRRQALYGTFGLAVMSLIIGIIMIAEALRRFPI